MQDTSAADRALIRELIENWVVWRDTGDFEHLGGAWHEGGVMCSTWRQSDALSFIDGAREAWKRGSKGFHALGGCSIELAGTRAVAQTKMNITQRAPVHDVLVDVVCHGIFYDVLEQRDGRWGIVLRQPIYERDRMDPVEPGAAVKLDPALLAKFPEGYRHLAYLQTSIGMLVKGDMPGTRGPEVDRLRALGRRWLTGENFDPVKAW